VAAVGLDKKYHVAAPDKLEKGAHLRIRGEKKIPQRSRIQAVLKLKEKLQKEEADLL